MFNKRLIHIMLTVFAVVFFTGCATSRGIMPLTVPAAGEAQTSRNVTVYISSVTDARVFESRPKSPDIPSLRGGSASQATEDIKARAIARKRNGFGKALGDILLPEDQTVSSVMREMVASAFRSAGYKVADSPANAVSLDVTIDKYWSWINMGAWALTITAHAETDIKATYPDKKTKTYKVFAKGSHRPQMASTANWQKAFRLMMEDYPARLGEALSKDPL